MENCWEFKGCGREEGGKRAHEMGVCPVYHETRLNGVHKGKNGGRACWVIEGSLCNNKKQGHFGEKFKECVHCEFYRKVKKEAGADFLLSPTLLRILSGKDQN